MQNTRNKELVSSYLKMHTTLSNAFKETEAVNGIYVKKMDEQTFKEKFESHLKKLATCEDYDICLTDGSKFNYGTYNEGCPTGTCMELTVDTNGNRMPNKSGKDIFTMLVTDRGIKALGESNMCETGLDCGAYILANHKLYDGTVEEVAPPAHEPDVEEPTPPVVEPEPEPQPTPEEIYNNCVASEAVSCTNANGELVYRDTNSCKASGSQSCTLFDGKTYYPNAADYSLCKTNGASICTTSSGQTVNKLGNYYGQNTYVADLTSQQSASADCASKGMHIASMDELRAISNTGQLKGGGYWSSSLSHKDSIQEYYYTFWQNNDSATEGFDFSTQQYNNMRTLCIAN